MIFMPFERSHLFKSINSYFQNITKLLKGRVYFTLFYAKVKGQLEAYFVAARLLAPVWTVKERREERQHLPPDGPVFLSAETDRKNLRMRVKG